jgi:hypothetical protein
MRERRCSCPLANAAYTNMLAEPATAAKIAAGMVRAPERKRIPLTAAR